MKSVLATCWNPSTTFVCKHAGKSVQFSAPDPCPPSVPVGDDTSCNYQTHDFTETKHLLEEEKTYQLEQMRKELEALCMRNAALEKRAVQDLQKETTLNDMHSNSLVTSKVEQILS